MKVTIKNGLLHGNIVVPPSKSAAHRAIICAALAEGESVIENVEMSKDIKATIDCVRKLGATVEIDGSTARIKGQTQSDNQGAVSFQCEESGSTLRFMIPIAAVMGIEGYFTGKPGLASRPLGEYLKIFDNKDIMFKSEGGLPLHVNGTLKGGIYKLRGDVSSQFVTGLLFALPLAGEDSEIRMTTPLESKGYVDMTLEALSRAGIVVEQVENEDTGLITYIIEGRQAYKNFSYRVEGDYSQAAFWLVSAALGSYDLKIGGLEEQSSQGDKAIIGILQETGCTLIKENGFIRVIRPADVVLKAFRADVSQIPDLVPALAALACVCKGRTVLYNGARLRIKESDRLYTTRMSLTALGGIIEEENDDLIINGRIQLSGGSSEAFNDHRIAMAMGAVAVACENNVVIEGAQCVEKSYPQFWKEYSNVGGKIDEWVLG